MNNKMIKGSVAGATGIVLLMGGFGTYALWSDSVTADADQIQAGNMDINLVEGPNDGWKDISPDAANTSWSPGTYMVPGDVVTFTETFNIDAVGKNLELDFSVDPLDPTAAPANWDNLEIAMSLNGTDLTEEAAGHFTAAAADASNHTLVVTFTFDGDTSDSDDEGAVLNLDNIGINIDQHRPGDTSAH